MKILFITKLYPYPSDAGGKLKTFRILKLLAKESDIYFLSFVDKNDDHIDISFLKTICKSVKVFVLPIINQNHFVLLGVKFFFSIFSRKPFIVYKYYSDEMDQYFKKIIQDYKFDYLYIDHLAMAQYIPVTYTGKVICDVHNISYLAFQTYAQTYNNILLKLIFRFESIKLKKYELFWLKRFTHIFTISNLDKKRIIRLGIPASKVTFLPTPFTVKRHYFHHHNTQVIFFVGLMSWVPNLKGIQWFISQVYPLIKKQIPGVKLVIVGKDGNQLQNYLDKHSADRSISYKGYVKNLKFFYSKTSVFIVPILMGGGIRIKLLEAFAHGLPVVSTYIGAEGIEVVNKKQVCIANTPEEFSKAVTYILKNQKFANKLAHNGQLLIKNFYSISKTIPILRRYLDTCNEIH